MVLDLVYVDVYIIFPPTPDVGVSANVANVVRVFSNSWSLQFFSNINTTDRRIIKLHRGQSGVLNITLLNKNPKL